MVGASNITNAEVSADKLLQGAREIANKLNGRLLIDGSFVDSASGNTFPTIDPRTEEPIIFVAEGDKPDVDAAVEAARKAFDHGPWPKLTGKQRGDLLYKLADLMETVADDFARLESLDVGKPYQVARTVDVPFAISVIRHFAGWADKIQGTTNRVNGPMMAYTLREPIGVCALIVPWNFPLCTLAMKLAPALAAGNTAIVKPAEQTPMTAVSLGALSVEAGFPPGVINILTGYGETAGRALASHPRIDMVSFTGSTEVGKEILRNSATYLKRVTLELGGKSPVIVAPDVNIDEVVEAAHQALFANAGQVCNAGSRLYVHEAIYDEFVEKAVKRAQNRRVGDPFDADTEQGPQVDKAQFDKVLHYIDVGNKEGARLLTGGGRAAGKGFYIQPTVFADVKEGMRIAQEEIFGPVQSILKWKDMQEVIERANSTNYGLAAAVFTKSIDTANTVSRGIRAGCIWVNCFHAMDPSMPWGGYKESGIGREGGEWALHEYTQVKAVWQPLVDPAWL